MLSVISVRGRLRPVPSRAGVRVPSVTTALGKAVLAFTDDESVLAQRDDRPRPAPASHARAGARHGAHRIGRHRPLRDLPRRGRGREPHPVAGAVAGGGDLGRGAGGRHGSRTGWRRSCGTRLSRSRIGWHCRWPDRCRDAAANDALGVLDRMTVDPRGLRRGRQGVGHLRARAARRPSQVHRLPAGRDARAPAIPRARREADPSGPAAVRARAARRAAAGAQGRRSAGHGRPSQHDGRERAPGHPRRREMVCIAVMRGRSAAPPTVRIGGRLPIHATALGKAVLAHSTRRPTSTRSLSSGLAAWTPQTITDPAALRRQLARHPTGRARRGGGGVRRRRVLRGEPGVRALGRGSWGRSRSRDARTDFDADRFAPAIRAAALALTRRLAPGRASGRTDARQCAPRPLRRSVIVATTMSPMSRRCESWSAGSSMSRSKMAANVWRLATWKHA